MLASGIKGLGWVFWKVGDKGIIDGLFVNGAAQSVYYFSKVLRRIQTGYIYHYAFAMIAGVVVLLIWFYILFTLES